MVIITDANGNVVKSIPENVYQGSNNANDIIVLAPFSENAQVTITYKLPDGTLSEPQLMTPYEDMPAEYSQYNAWKISLERAFTQLYGTVQMQFRAYTNSYSMAQQNAYIVSGATALTSGWLSATSGGTALTPVLNKLYLVQTSGTYYGKSYRWNGTAYYEVDATDYRQTIATFGCSFVVQRGVQPILPTTPTQTIYEQILEALADLDSEIINLNARVGLNANLNTTEKGTIVGAINEVNTIAVQNEGDIADLDERVTDAESDIDTLETALSNKVDKTASNTSYNSTTSINNNGLTTVIKRYKTGEESNKYASITLSEGSSNLNVINFKVKYGDNEKVLQLTDSTATIDGVEIATEGWVQAVNNLTNYYTKSQTYSQSEVNALIGAIEKVTFVVAQTLPTASASTLNKIYLIPSTTVTTGNVKDEFITITSTGNIEESLTVTSTAGMILTFTTDINDYVTALENQALSTTDTYTFEYKALPLSAKYTLNDSEITITRDAEEDGTGYYYWYDSAHGVAYYTNTPVLTADTTIYSDSGLNTVASSLDFVSIQSYSTTDGYWYSDDIPDADSGEYGTPVDLSDYGISYTGTATIGSKFTTTYVAPETNVTIYSWEQIGTTAVDLSNYYNKAQTEAKIAETDVTSLTSVDTVVGTPVVDYNTTDGITIESTAKIVYGDDNDEQEVELSQEIPLVPADASISMDADADNEKVEIKAVGLNIGSQSSVTDLTNTTWLLNSSITSAGDVDFSVDFDMNYYNGTSIEATTGNTLKFSSVSTDPVIKIFDTATQKATLYENSVWDSSDGVNTYTPSASADIQALRTITITGGTDVASSALLTWIKANGTMTETITGTEIKSKIDVIKTNGDGSKYLANDGTYKTVTSVEEDDVTITKNSDDELQTVAVIDQNTGNADKIFSGAKSDLPATLDTNTFYAYPSAGTYKGAWVTGTTYTEDDVVYVDTSSTVRAYYEMISVSDITSTTSPESDTTNWKKLFEVPVSSGGQLYNHIIKINQSAGVTFSIYLVIINNISTIFTDTTLANWLYNNNFTSSDTIYPCSSKFAASRVTATYNNILNKGVGVYSSNGTTPAILFTKAAFTISNSEISINTGLATVYFSGTLTDTVTPL